MNARNSEDRSGFDVANSVPCFGHCFYHFGSIAHFRSRERLGGLACASATGRSLLVEKGPKVPRTAPKMVGLFIKVATL